MNKRKTLQFEVNSEAIIEIVGEVTGYNPQENLLTRKMPYPEVRFMAMFFIRKYTRKSLSKIGKMFDKDHASVLHACKQMGDWIDTDERIRNMYVCIDLKIKDRVISLDTIPDDVPLTEQLYQAKKNNFSLLHTNITLRSKIKNLPIHIKKQYFGDDQQLYPIESKNKDLAVV